MTRTPSSTRVRLSTLPRRPHSRASLAVLAACGVLVCSTALAQRVAPGALPSGPLGMPSVAGAPALRGPEVVSGNFGAYTVNGNVGRIKQNDRSWQISSRSESCWIEAGRCPTDPEPRRRTDSQFHPGW